MRNHYLIILALSVISLIGCDRAAEESASVVITLPPASAPLSKADYSSLSDDNPDDDDLPWSSVIPDGLSGQSGVQYPINCYAVMVEGAELAMRVNTCGRQGTTQKIDPLQFNFKVGLWMGAFAGNTSGAPNVITMDVPIGLSRIFRLIGFHVDDPLDCILLHEDVPRDTLSRPYVIAESAPIDLVPGDRDLPLTMTFDSNKWFDECDFGSGSNNNSPPPIATRIQIRKDSFPFGKFVQNNANVRCQAIEVQLTDDAFRPAQLPSTLQQITYELRNSGAPLSTYANKQLCLADTSGTTGAVNFNVMAGNTNSVRRWIRMPAGTGGATYSLQLVEALRLPVGAPGTILPEPPQMMSVYSETLNFYDIIAPQRAYRDEVFVADVLYRSFNGYNFSMGGTSLMLASANATASDFFVYDFAAGSCLATSLAGFSMSSLFVKQLCLDFSSTEGARIDYTGPFFTKLESSSGSDDPYRLRVVGTNQVSVPSAGNRTYGPFVVMLENEFGTTINNEEGAPINVMYSFSSGSPVNDFTSANPISYHQSETIGTVISAGSVWSNANPLVISNNNYKASFYINVPSTAQLGFRRIDLTSTLPDGRVIRGFFSFSIDEPDAP